MIPAAANAEFVAHVEDVLEVYKQPYDPLYPQVCFAECSKQLVSETRHPLPLEPGQPVRYDYEYEREGVANLFLFSEPLTGWRRSRSPNGARRSIMLSQRNLWWMRAIQARFGFAWCKTNSIPIVRRRSTKRSRPLRPNGSWISWSFTPPHPWQLAQHGGD